MEASNLLPKVLHLAVTFAPTSSVGVLREVGGSAPSQHIADGGELSRRSLKIAGYLALNIL